MGFYVLPSLTKLLLRWAQSETGRKSLDAIPENAALRSDLQSLSLTAERMTGQPPSSDVLAAAFISLLS